MLLLITIISTLVQTTQKTNREEKAEMKRTVIRQRAILGKSRSALPGLVKNNDFSFGSLQ